MLDNHVHVFRDMQRPYALFLCTVVKLVGEKILAVLRVPVLCPDNYRMYVVLF